MQRIKMSDVRHYKDIYGHSFTLTNLPSAERLKKEQDKPLKCQKKEELKRLVQKLFSAKPNLTPVEVIPTTYKKRTVKKYFQPGLIVQVDNRTSACDLQRLFHVGARTLFVRLGYATPGELSEMMKLIHNEIEGFHKSQPYLSPIGIAMEIRGHGLRTGRVRNDKPIDIGVNTLLVLTCDPKYKYLAQREIVYVWNMRKYIPLVQLGDIIFVNRSKIQLKVLKILPQNITCCVEKGSSIRSYMDVEMPYYVANDFEQSTEDVEDIQFAMSHQAQFIVLPSVSNVGYIKHFKQFLKGMNCDFDVLAAINTCIATNKCIAKDIVESCDGVWLDKLFKREGAFFAVDQTTMCLIELATKLEIPITGKIPIKTRPDYMSLEKDKVLNYLDSILIEKSPKTLTFPLIARKLFCISTPQEDCPSLPTQKDTDDAAPIGSAIVEPMSFHITIQKCVAIIISSTVNHTTAKLLSRKHIYCPIIVVAENDTIGKQLNIYRNMKVVVLRDEDATEEKRLEYGMDYGVNLKLLAEGDFILSFYDSMYYDCVTSRYRAMHVPKKQVIAEKFSRLTYSCGAVRDGTW